MVISYFYSVISVNSPFTELESVDSEIITFFFSFLIVNGIKLQ